jgi:hypothetical protein
MGRHKQPEIRDRILDACVDHALTHGLEESAAHMPGTRGATEPLA